MTNAKNLSRRRAIAAAMTGVAGLAAPWVIGSARAGAAIRIGHLTDVSGPYSANSGAVSVACARRPKSARGPLNGLFASRDPSVSVTAMDLFSL